MSNIIMSILFLKRKDLLKIVKHAPIEKKNSDPIPKPKIGYHVLVKNKTLKRAIIHPFVYFNNRNTNGLNRTIIIKSLINQRGPLIGVKDKYEL